MAYEAGTAYISVLPSLKGFQTSINAQLKGVSAQLVVPIKPEVDPATKERTRKDGDEAAGSFADAFRARLKAALKALPKVEITADSSLADIKIAEVRAALEDLSSKRIGVDIDDATALSRLAMLQAQLDDIGRKDTRASVKIDTAQASAQLAQLRSTIQGALNPDTAASGERAAGEWADSFRKRLDASIEALPDVQITADSSKADIVIAGVRERLQSLRDQRIGIDVSAADAVAKVAVLRSALEDVGKSSSNIEVKADTSAAAIKLAEIKAEADDLTKKPAKFDVDVDDKGSASKTSGNVRVLRDTLIALSPAALPIAASLVPAIAGIGLAAVGAVAGIGVLKLGLSGVSDAMQAMDQQQQTTAENAGKTAQQIADAELSLQDARESAAESAISSAEAVANAQQSAADAERTAAEQVQRALQQQQQAEQSLVDAQRQALRAQQDLNDARQEATRSLEDMQIAAQQADIDQQSAVLALAQAQQAFAAARANPSAAPGQVQQAQLQLQQAQLTVQSSNIKQSRAHEDLSTVQAQGVEGSKQVRSAQDAVTSANEGVSNAQQGVANANQGLADAQIEAAEKVAGAQQALSDAYRQQAVQARQSAESIQKAQEALGNAENANASAVNKTKEALAQLTPQGRAFVQFLEGLKPEFKSIQDAAQSALLPGLQAGISALLPSLPQIRTLVGGIAGALGDMAKQAGQALGGPWWQDFFRTVGSQITPAIRTMGGILGNFAQGAAGVFRGLLPLANDFGQSLLGMSRDFAGLGDSPGFKEFIGYVRDSLPTVGGIFRDVGDAIGVLLKPLAGLGSTLLESIKKLTPSLTPAAKLIGAIADSLKPLLSDLGSLGGVVLPPVLDLLTKLAPILAPIAVGVLAVVGAVKAFAVAQEIILGIKVAWQLLSLAFAESPIGLIIILLVGLVAGLIYAYQNSETFRDIVNDVFRAIGDVFNWIWNNILKPVLGWIGDGLKVLGDVFNWLYQNVIKPAWDAISTAITWAWDNIIKPAFVAFQLMIQGVGKAFSDVVDGIKTVWGTLQKIVGTPVKFILDVVYNQGIAAMWNKIADFLGIGKLPLIDTSTIPSFAGGGVLGGYAPGRDMVPAMLSPGEAVLVPEAVRALGAGNILALNAAYSGRKPTITGGPVQAFAGGGIVDNVLGFLGGALGDVAKFLTDPLGSIKDALGDSKTVELLAQIPGKAIDDVADWLWSKLLGGGSSNGSSSAGAPAASAQLAQWIAAAIADTGVPGAWAGPLTTLIMRESGGNPSAINLWDSNAKAGHPSQGLMQTIPSTFARYRDPKLSSSITDPVANIVAGINYIKATYGSVFNVQQGNASLPPKGYSGGGIVPTLYDSGGILPPGYSTVLNATGRPEAVFTPSQLSLLASVANNTASGGQFTGQLYLDGGGKSALVGIVRGEIQQADHGTGTAIAQRSRI